MRILYVVQRYGPEVAGGAEQHCRMFAERLADMGHEVHVLTSCALSYVDWQDHYPAGTDDLAGVTVHRLPVVQPREDRVFGPLNGRVVWSQGTVPPFLQREWMRIQGPWLAGLDEWLADRASDFDLVIFFTYLYYTTYQGLHQAAGRVPTLLHPTAHDEPPIYLPIFRTMFRLPTAFAFSTEEERDFIASLMDFRPRGDVIGIGMDLETTADETIFRQRWQCDDPFILFLGRIDPGKGSEELYDFFTTYKQRNPGPLKLVMMGEPVRPVPPHVDVIVTGFVDGEIKRSALSGCLALVQPSYFESFSMVLTEAWSMKRPALVQEHCDVLKGQALRSGGGIPYRDYASFEVALQRLLEDPSIGRSLGNSGSAYVRSRYTWDAVMARYTRLLERTASRGRISSVVNGASR